MNQPHEYEVLHREEKYRGAIFTVVSDEVSMPGGGSARRDYTRNFNAAIVVALDDAGQIVLVNQYRHPVGAFLWELPAGLVDVAGESGAQTARRELAEEADLVAARWDLLVELHTSPGFTDEKASVYLARELSPVPDADRHLRAHEEADLTLRRVDLDEAVAMVFRSEITNAAAVAGVLSAARARDQNWAPLRPADPA